MNNSDANKDESKQSGWLRLKSLLSSAPKTTEDVVAIVDAASENEVIGKDAKRIIEGALEVSEMQARDIMIPRSQMVFIKAECTLEDILPQITRSAHSRYPVVGDSPDVILGILLAKDLLPQILNLDNDSFKIEELLRPAMVVPESKRLNVLLREFRENRNHMAIVIDEYGGVAGLVTIEDVLEEIVGEIEDETDAQVDRHIHMIDTNEFMVKALTPIEEFNTYFECEFSDDDFDTIGGLVTQAFGHMPTRHEVTTINGFKFEVIKADQRKIYSLRMQRPRI